MILPKILTLGMLKRSKQLAALPTKSLVKEEEGGPPMTKKSTKGRIHKPSQAVFEDIINEFEDALHTSIIKTSRAKHKQVSDFCCVIGPTTGTEPADEDFTLTSCERKSFIERLKTVDAEAAEKVGASLDNNTVRVVVFLKGAVYVKDIPLMPALNSRGGSA